MMTANLQLNMRHGHYLQESVDQASVNTVNTTRSRASHQGHRQNWGLRGSLPGEESACKLFLYLVQLGFSWTLIWRFFIVDYGSEDSVNSLLGRSLPHQPESEGTRRTRAGLYTLKNAAPKVVSPCLWLSFLVWKGVTRQSSALGGGHCACSPAEEENCELP